MYHWDILDKDSNVYVKPIETESIYKGFQNKKTLRVKYTISSVDCDMSRDGIGLGVAFLYSDALHRAHFRSTEQSWKHDADVIMLTPHGLIHTSKNGEIAV